MFFKGVAKFYSLFDRDISCLMGFFTNPDDIT